MPNMNSASLETRSRRNTDASAVPTGTFAVFDKTDREGFVLPGNANAGAVAGLVEERGIDPTTSLPVANIPVGQISRLRFRGVGVARCDAVAVKAGEDAYMVASGAAKGKVTNVATNNTLVGVFVSDTDGTADRLVSVSIDLA